MLATVISTFCLSLWAAGLLGTMENTLLKYRYLLTPGEASGQIVLVQIDRASIDKIGVWPWPRRHHALLLERLRSAEASGVFFDIDFSALSSSQDDLILRRAFERAGQMVHLAVFSDTSQERGSYIDIGPNAETLSAINPVSVNMQAQADGKIWKAFSDRNWRGRPIPSMFEALATVVDAPNPFWIDYGIDVETVPALSFADVAIGNFDPATIRGKRVIIGATAIELGDTFASPTGQILPGAMIQILAAESLIQGRALQQTAHLAPTLLVVLGSAATLLLIQRMRWQFAVTGSLGILAGSFLLSVAIQRETQLIVDIAPAFVAVPISIVAGFVDKSDYLDWRLLLESVKLHRANALMSNVTRSMRDGLLTLNTDGSVETANIAALRMFGLRETDLQHQSIARFCIWPRLASSGAIDSALQFAARRDISTRVICRSHDGTQFYGEVSVSQLPTELPTRWIVVIRDATEKVGADRQARRRERDLKALKIKAELATRAKTEFVATMSHELRTPLNAMIGCATIMHSEQLGELGDAYRGFASEIVQGGARLERLLSHILEYANAEMDLVNLDCVECDAVALVREAIALQAKRANVAGVAVSFEGADFCEKIVADYVAIQKAVGNILANAIRFNKRGGWVNLSVAQRPTDQIEITIEDNGIGIAQDQINFCFEPFYQVDQTDRRGLDGAGLGLTVAERFVQLHGGVISLGSELGIGTKVSFLLPRRSTDQV